MRIAWDEFRTHLLPWVLAAAVIALQQWTTVRSTDQWVEANLTLSQSLDRQGQAIDGISKLLSSQGYTVPPLVGKSSLRLTD